ncbi:hypothetical protein TL16_g04346 [Triparma laevis f. inornata]|uniref:Ionotropic glutamate receptor C-terminal domain-containing protein n=1 Tax=Triparma laevis f. inornata TaxID=1714386 RepID=A0A9W7AAU0_9STRA|nr:hypothetical protein TL16_g04346 [Triparma laevis f. inornata]
MLRHLLPLLLFPTLTVNSYEWNATAICDARRTNSPTNCSLRGDQLRGQHINFTFVEVPHFLEFVRDPITEEIIFEDISSGLLFKSDHRNTTYGAGFLNDMLGWISHHAGFTYSAYIASGRCENDGKGLYNSTYSNNYKIASTDVFEDECTVKTTGEPGKGRTDAYLGIFFITNERMSKNDFTIPFLSNKGLSIALPNDLEDCKKGSLGNKTQTFIDNSKLLQPFDNELWYGIFFYLLFACFLLMIVEGSWEDFVKHESELTLLVQNRCNDDDSGFKTRPVGEGLPHGYLTVQGIHEHFLYYFFRTFQSILAGNELPEVLTAEGRVMNIWLAICSVVILAAYTANLTVFLIADVPHTVEGISDLIDRNIPTYLPSDSAFSDWVIAAYPELNAKVRQGVKKIEAIMYP